MGVWDGTVVWEGVGGGAVKIGGRGVSAAGVGVLGVVQLGVIVRMKVNRRKADSLSARMPEIGEFISQF